MRREVTTALDVLGLLAVAAGAFFALRAYLGLAAVGVAGVVVLAGSAFFAWQGRAGGEL